MTHIGKIGRLPKTIRHELGRRLEDGQPGTEIVHWLNHEPAVQRALHDYFAGRPITEQNLSDWRQTGHVHWLRQQVAQAATIGLLEQADDLPKPLQKGQLTDRFALIIASQMTQLAMTLIEEETDPEKKWQRLCEINQQLSRLRRDDQRSTTTTIQQERWDREQTLAEKEAADRQEQGERKKMLDMLLEGQNREFNERLFGGGFAGQRRAEMFYRLKCGLDIEDMLDGSWDEEHRPKAVVPKTPKRPRKTCRQRRVQKPGKKPEEGSESGLIVSNRTDSEKESQSHGAPVSEPARFQPTPVPTQPATIPTPSSVGPVPPPGEPTPAPQPPEPSAPSSTEPAETTVIDPLKEAQGWWWRMYWRFEPYDKAKLIDLYMKVPPDQKHLIEPLYRWPMNDPNCPY